MCYKNIFSQYVINRPGYILESWGISDHFICNSGKCLDITWDRLAGINKCFKFFNHFFTIKYINSQFGDPVCGSIAARGFYVDDGVQWLMVNGQWSMVNGQWSMVNGQWSMVN